LSRKRPHPKFESGPADTQDRQRLDLWLWYARFYKTRSLAARLCAAGVVEIAGLPVQRASQLVRVGDLVTLVQGGYRLSVAVLGMAEHRGPASAAAQLYRQIGPRIRIGNADPAWQAILADEGGDYEG
jgi:ribosome-associated heat shock protein Hsp15